jgi:hypothetical protein
LNIGFPQAYLEFRLFNVFQFDCIHEDNVSWEKAIHDAFKNKFGKSNDRMRRLAPDLSRQEEGRAPLFKLSEIAPRMARAYANRTPRTLLQDMNTLLKMDMI